MADSKHTVGDLRQLQSLPLRLKIMLTQQRIRDWYEHWDGQVYVSFSGGKDSTVLKHIVDSMYSDVPAVFVNTGLEYPEIQRFVREVKAGKYDCFNPDVEILRPEMRFCMFGAHLEKEPNRFQRMKVTHPKQYAYCMDKLGLREVLEYIGVPYE